MDIEERQFEEFPFKYKPCMKCIQNECIRNIYKQFKFKYFSFQCQQEKLISYITSQLSKHKFITYEISKNHNINIMIICTENTCFFIDLIQDKYISKILTNYKFNSINLTSEEFNPELTKEDVSAQSEVSEFCENFQIKILMNKHLFIKLTIKPVVSYLIQRYYKNPDLFEDQTFLNFDKLVEKNISNPEKLEQIQNKVFNMKDFIKIRTICGGYKKVFNLVMHVDTLYIFLMKIDNEIKNEIDFCLKYSSKYLCKFYGFVEDNNKVTAMIYEFMHNGSLSDYIKKHGNQINCLDKLKILKRIIKGIEFLHKNGIIHCDIKSTNIYINGNNKPVIGDFGTIIDTNQENGGGKDPIIGSILFASPEIENGEEVDFSTDIYSFGHLIYLIFEEKNMFEKNRYYENFPAMINAPNEFQFLLNSCLCFKPKERPEINLIKGVIYFSIGQAHLNGFTGQKDYKKAKKYFKISIKFNNVSALNALGIIYSCGEGCKKNIKKTLTCFENAEKQGSIEAIYHIAILYYMGKGLPKNIEEAKRRFEICAKENYSDAFNSLGYISQHIDHDIIKAIKYYENASYDNLPIAFYNLGKIYFEGVGTSVNYNLARINFEKAAKNNHSDSFYYLGLIYFKGLGVDKNITTAKYYFELSAKQNNSNSYFYIGCIHRYGLEVPKDFKKAMEYFLLAANQNYPDAFYEIGKMFFKGKGVEQDFDKALHNYELSATYNYFDRFFDLGFIYEKGIGVRRDINKAIDYYTKCTKFLDYSIIYEYDHAFYEKRRKNNNYYRSFNDLGLIYLVEKDFLNTKFAREYLKIAAKNDYPFAQNNYGLFLKYYEEKDYKKAYEMFNRASCNKFSLGEFNLACIDEEMNNKESAIEHYHKALSLENSILMFHNRLINDERLELSKIFIFCYINLKLTHYYLSKENYDANFARYHFINALFKPLFGLLIHSKKHSYSFQFKSLNLMDFFLNNPLFSLNKKDSSEWMIFEPNKDMSTYVKILLNQNKDVFNDENKNHLKMEIKDIFNYLNYRKKYVLIDENDQVDQISFKLKENEANRQLKYPRAIDKILLKDKTQIKNEIEKVLVKANEILFTPPYSILFGRINFLQK